MFAFEIPAPLKLTQVISKNKRQNKTKTLRINHVLPGLTIYSVIFDQACLENSKFERNSITITMLKNLKALQKQNKWHTTLKSEICLWLTLSNKEHFHFWKFSAICYLSWLRESWHPFHWQRINQVSKWSPTWKGRGLTNHQGIHCMPGEDHSISDAERYSLCNPSTRTHKRQRTIYTKN